VLVVLFYVAENSMKSILCPQCHAESCVQFECWIEIKA
jgi:hypothetical protein